MVVIVSREGQLANRVLHASSFIVNAKEHNYKIHHPFFEEYYAVFSEGLRSKEDLIKFWGKKQTKIVSLFQRTITFVIKVFLKLNIRKLPYLEIIEYKGYEQGQSIYDLNRDEFIKKAKSKLVLVHGWLFRDPVNQEKYKQLLREMWRPNKSYRTNIENFRQQYLQGHDVMIGVHIRGGDYRKFEGGKWFYTPEQYFVKMKEIAELEIFRNKKIAFIVCTNEKNISLPSHEKFSIFNDERHFVEDIYLLSECDYIIGPPSTFSIWASFYGDVPLLMIKDISININGEYFDKNTRVYS